MAISPDSIRRLAKCTTKEFVEYERRQSHVKVRRLRAELALSQADLAAELGVTTNTIGNYEDLDGTAVPACVIDTMLAMVELQRERRAAL